MLTNLSRAGAGLVFLGIAAIAADLETGRRQYEEKHFAEAEATLRQVVAEAPENVEANHYLGLALLEEKKYKESAEFLEKAAPASPRAKVDLGKAYMFDERLDDALRVLGEAEDQAKADESTAEATNADLFLTRGMILLKQEKFTEAATALDRTLALEPKNAYGHYYMGMTQSKLRRSDRMVEQFEMFLKLAPDSPEAARVRSLLRSVR